MAALSVAQTVDQQMEELVTAFNFFDKDGTGTLSIRDAGVLLRTLGDAEAVSPESLALLCPDGRLSLQAFLDFRAHKRTAPAITADVLMQAFRCFDRDNSGKVSCEEIARELLAGSSTFTAEDVAQFLHDAGVGAERGAERGFFDYQPLVEKITKGS